MFLARKVSKLIHKAIDEKTVDEDSCNFINEDNHSDFIIENRRPSIEITQIDEEKNLGSKKIQKMFKNHENTSQCQHQTDLTILTHEISKLNDKFEELQISLNSQAKRIENIENSLYGKDDDLICPPLPIISSNFASIISPKKMSSSSSFDSPPEDSDSGCSKPVYQSVIIPATSAVKTIIKIANLIRSGSYQLFEVMDILEKLGSQMKVIGKKVAIFLETCSFRQDLTCENSDLDVVDRIKLIQITINRDLQTVIDLVNNCEGKDGLDSKKLLLTSHALAQDLKNLVDTVKENSENE